MSIVLTVWGFIPVFSSGASSKSNTLGVQALWAGTSPLPLVLTCDLLDFNEATWTPCDVLWRMGGSRARSEAAMVVEHQWPRLPRPSFQPGLSGASNVLLTRFTGSHSSEEIQQPVNHPSVSALRLHNGAWMYHIQEIDEESFWLLHRGRWRRAAPEY